MDPTLITKDVRDKLYEVLVEGEDYNSMSQAMVQNVKKILDSLHPVAYNVLRYLMFHLKLIASVKGEIFYTKVI